MSSTLRILQGIAALVALATGATARDEVLLTDHHLLDGKVVASSETSVTLRCSGATTDMVIPVDHIEPYSFYVIRDLAIGDDAAARMVLGRFCLENGLFPRARRQFEKAEQLDPSLKKEADAGIASSREGSAAQLISEAGADQKSGNAYGAMQSLTDALRYYPDTQAGNAARGQVDELHQQMLADRAKARAAQDNKHAAEDLKRVQAALDRAAGFDKQGLQAKDQSQSIQGFEQSLAEYKRAKSELTSLATKYKADPGILETIQGESSQADQDMIGVHLDLGSVYVTRTSYQDALGQANQALAIDPNNSRATAFRQRVESCSASGTIFL